MHAELKKAYQDYVATKRNNKSITIRLEEELYDLEKQLEKIVQELSELYIEQTDCDDFVTKHSNTFRKFKDKYTYKIEYFKKSVHLSNMLFIMFSFAFGIGLLAAFLTWFEDESIVASLICIALMTTLCVVAYIVCNKYIDKYCTHLAKEDSDIDIQQTVNKLIQADKCQALKNALLEAGLIEEYEKIEQKYENISENIHGNNDFCDFCNLPPSD